MHAPLSDSQSARAKRSSMSPATLSASDTFGLFGCSYSTGMSLIQSGRFPVEPIRIGRCYRFRKIDVFAFLGIDDSAISPFVESAT